MRQLVRAALILGTAVVFVVILAACGAGSKTSAPAPGSHAMTHPIIVPTKSGHPDAVYEPNPIRVHLGQTIVWKNDDTDDPHTVTSDNYYFDSGPIAAGASWSWRPFKTGVFHYYCTLHPEMKGVIIVTK